jgi:hypothetical protein
MTTSSVPRTGNDLEAGCAPQEGPADAQGAVLKYLVAGADIVGDHVGAPGLDCIEMVGITRQEIHAYLHGEDACRELAGTCPLPLNQDCPILSTAAQGIYVLSTAGTPTPSARDMAGTNGKLNVGSGPGVPRPRPR